MEVILIHDVEKVGSKGDVVQVRDGFARNFLIPRRLAFSATRENQEFVEQLKVKAAGRRAKLKAEAETKVKALQGLKLSIESAAGEKDRLFGSVTSDDIARALADKGYVIDKKKILVKESLRSLGTHSVTIEIYPQVKAVISIEIIRKA